METHQLKQENLLLSMLRVRAQLPSNDAAQENGIDTTGAFAVYGLTRLIPETCPNCGAKTYGNWTRTDDGFACTLCDELY